MICSLSNNPANKKPAHGLAVRGTNKLRRRPCAEHRVSYALHTVFGAFGRIAPERLVSEWSRRRKALRAIVLIALGAQVAPTWASAAADNEPPPDKPVTWTFVFADDNLFDSDNQFTGGGSIHMHSGVFDNLKDVHGTLAFGKTLAKYVLPHRADLRYREGWSFGHSEQTPEHLGDRNLIKNDYPYVGLLAWSNVFTAFNDRDLYSAQLLLGWVGPATLGKQIQTAIHSVGGNHPHGWGNQINNEPIVNLYYTYQHKLWRQPHFDVASSMTGALGNYYTYGQSGLVARIGQLPQGFASMPDPPGRGIDYEATMTPDSHGDLYMTLAVRGTAVGYSTVRDGNAFRTDNDWTEHNTLDVNPVVGQFIGGLHYVRPHWGMHFEVWATTATVKKRTLASDSDAYNNFGAARVEWRFD